MNFLMLRGEYPRDRKNPAEILYASLEAETDMYTHLWYNVLEPTDRGTVLYFGHKYRAQYRSNFDVQCVPKLEDYRTGEVPSVIFCRGNREEYKPLLSRWPMAKRVYYGAGKDFVPPHRNYDIVLVDSEDQARKIQKGMHIRTGLFLKPAAPHFKIVPCEKRYDVCFVAVHPKDPRKRVSWVYETVPKDLKVLQVGDKPKKHPKNVTVVRATREQMPGLMNQCRVGIVPSTSDDSGPRVVPEFIACGLPVVVSSDVQLDHEAYRAYRASPAGFWKLVNWVLKAKDHSRDPEACPIGCQAAGRRLRWQMEENR